MKKAGTGVNITDKAEELYYWPTQYIHGRIVKTWQDQNFLNGKNNTRSRSNLRNKGKRKDRTMNIVNNVVRKLKKLADRKKTHNNYEPEPREIFINYDRPGGESGLIEDLEAHKACESWEDLLWVINLIQREWSSRSNERVIDSRDINALLKCLNYIINSVPDILKNDGIRGYIENKFPRSIQEYQSGDHKDQSLSARIKRYLEYTHKSFGTDYWWCGDDVSRCLLHILSYELGLSKHNLNYISALLIPVLLHVYGRKQKVEKAIQLLEKYEAYLPKGVCHFECVDTDGIIEIRETHEPFAVDMGYFKVYGFWPWGIKTHNEILTDCHLFISSITLAPTFFLEKLESYLMSKMALVRPDN